MQKKWLLGFLTFFFMFFVACSNDTSNDTTQNGEEQVQTEQEQDVETSEAADEEGSGGFLWKATHNGNTVYMLGSIHVATKDFYPLHSKIENAFTQSDYLAVEADVVNMGNMMEMSKLINEKAMYADGTTLKDHLPEELYTQLKTYMSDTGFPMEMVDSYEPWYVYMLLDSLQVMRLGYDSTLGIDYHFLESANEMEKEIIELESVEFQLNLLDNFSEEVQQSLLKTTLENQENASEEMKKMAELWKNGDEEGMKDYLFSEEAETEADEEFMEAMLDDRNVGMADKIADFLNSGIEETYFVIVGAAHYFGDNGVLQLLEDKGYTIEKVL